MEYLEPERQVQTEYPELADCLEEIECLESMGGLTATPIRS
jgi:hypothetical protein